jgi:lysophospholipase L1-like esterase
MRDTRRGWLKICHLAFVSLMMGCSLHSALTHAAEPSPPGTVSITLIGDSTVARYDQPPADRPTLTGWGQVLPEFLDDRVTVSNLAVSGRSSKSFRAEERWAPVLDARPTYVFIQFGHNDQPGKGDRSTDPQTEFRDHLRAYVREAREKQIQPVLVTPVARRTFESDKAVSSLGPWVEAMQVVSTEEQVPLIDLHAQSLALFGALGDAATAPYSPSADDRTHFSRVGARVMAALVAAQLPVTVPALTKHIRHDLVADTLPAPVDFPGRLRLQVPPVLDAVVGVETNLYFDNLVLTPQPDQYAFDVQCAKGRQWAQRWSFTPTAADVGDHPFVLDVRDEQQALLGRARGTLRVRPAEAGAGRELTVLFIGDSLTHASLYPRQVLDRARGEQQPRIRLMGSHTPAGAPPEVRHEGYGGWTAVRFATHAQGTPRAGDSAGRASPFLYPNGEGKPALDFTRYFADVNEGRTPDVVCLFLGPNDIYPDTEATIEASIDRMLRHFDLLVRECERAAPQAHIGVLLPVPPAASQDAFGANYGSAQTRWQYRRNQHRLVERMTAHYGAWPGGRVRLLPTQAGLDCRHNYPTARAPFNAQTEEQGVFQNNGVHPDPAGYRQIGDTVYGWLLGLPR